MELQLGINNYIHLYVEKLPRSQDKFQDNSKDDIYMEEEDQHDVTFSPTDLDEDSFRSSEAWSEQSSQKIDVRIFFIYYH